MPTLSIVIPAYNEVSRLPQTLAAIAGYFARPQEDLELKEVLVADDGSADETVVLAQSWGDRLPMTVVRLPENRGKGAAVREGMLAAKGDLRLMYDADGATPIEEVRRLYDVMRKENADVAIGSRVEKNMDVSMQWHRRLIGRIYHALCGGLVKGVRDNACGCKLFTAACAKDIFPLQTIDRFAFDVEVLALAQRRGWKIAEVPVHWHAVEKSKVRIFRDGPQMVWCILMLYWAKFTRKGAAGTEPPGRYAARS